MKKFTLKYPRVVLLCIQLHLILFYIPLSTGYKILYPHFAYSYMNRPSYSFRRYIVYRTFKNFYLRKGVLWLSNSGSNCWQDKGKWKLPMHLRESCKCFNKQIRCWNELIHRFLNKKLLGRWCWWVLWSLMQIGVTFPLLIALFKPFKAGTPQTQPRLCGAGP